MGPQPRAQRLGNQVIYRIFVDESKAKDYLMVAVTIPSSRVDQTRTTIRGLVMPGARRVHMHRESDRRKRTILTTLATLPFQATLYNAGNQGSERQRRDRCLAAIIHDAATTTPALITLEADNTLKAADLRTLYKAREAAEAFNTVTYDHVSSHHDLALAIPDSIAWAWARGGQWHQRVRPLLREVKRV